MDADKNAWYFIVNPRAGSGRTMSKWIPAEKLLEAFGVDYTTALTDHRKHATKLAYEAASEGYRKIAAVGGDGSLHETLAGIVNYCDITGTPTEEFCIAVVPIGSGNDWIKAFNVPNNTEEVIKLISSNSFTMMDIVTVHSDGGKKSFMANVGGIGFDSHVCVRVNMQKESGKRNKAIYLNALRHTVLHLSAINVKIIADSKDVFEGDIFSLAMGNGKYSGSGMRQVPLANPNDGMLDYMIVPKTKLSALLKSTPSLFNGTLNESKAVISGRCKSLQIVPLDEDSKDVIELDGEIEGRIPMSVVMDGRKINVLKG